MYPTYYGYNQFTYQITGHKLKKENIITAIKDKTN